MVKEGFFECDIEMDEQVFEVKSYIVDDPIDGPLVDIEEISPEPPEDFDHILAIEKVWEHARRRD